uniref:Serpin domain-containing protein n=1 Tax=Setaria italica TaxID=4555 RepID=K3ZC93_SETIT
DGACSAGNLVFSPLSIYSSLSVMAAGARGRNLSELLHVVGATCREGGLLWARNMSMPQFPRHSMYTYSLAGRARRSMEPPRHDGVEPELPPRAPTGVACQCWRVPGAQAQDILRSTTTSLKHALHQDLGIETMFSTGAADLPDMLELDGSHEPLFLSDILHKAVFEVGEEGLSPTVQRTKRQSVSVDFVADHPFIFFVVEEESGGIVLAGHVLDPTQKS